MANRVTEEKKREREKLQKKIDAFLLKGNEIEKIEKGVSGNSRSPEARKTLYNSINHPLKKKESKQ